jgi:iron complex outermembrane recepter protein
MFKRTTISACALLALGGGALLTPVASTAQTADSPQRIEITGSLIRRISSEAALPVVTLNVEELQKSGVTNAEQAVKFITQQQGGTVTSGSVSGTNGAAAYADLRSLGPQRTLVLLNGKRVASNPFSTVATDLNTLPMAAIARIEVLPDGASAIYGTDAIAGVINFITHKNYKGGAINAMAQVTEDGGGNVYTAGVLGGLGDIGSQGWNMLGGFNVRQQKPMRGDERAFSRTSYQPENGFNALSPTAFPANYSQGTLVANPTVPGCLPPGSISAPEANGTVIRCFADTQIFTNTVPLQDQNSLFLRGALALGKDHTASLEYLRGYNRVRTRIAPSPETGLSMPNTSTYYPGRGVTPANSALNPALPIAINWRTVPLGSREGEQENVTQRLVAGIEGSLAGWDYNANLLSSSAKVENFFLNGYPTTTAMRAGVSGCASGYVAATGACATPLLVNGAPFYLNPFGQATPAELAYLQANSVLGKVQEGESKTIGGAATVSGTLTEMAGGALAVAASAEYREEEMVYRTDIPKVSQAASSGLAGSGALREGDRKIGAISVELDIPLMKGLNLGASVRHDKYSDFGTTTNPKLSIRWQPNSTVLLRGSANTGFTAPTLTQLYSPNATTFTANRYNDPLLCPGGVVAANGVSTRDCGIQFQRLTGGTTTLDAEESRAWTAGFVIQPNANFSFGMDYWSYYIKNSLSTIGEQSIFADPTKYAGLFVRCSQADPARRTAIGACQNIVGTGDPLAYVIDVNANLGDVRTKGVDVQANYASGATGSGRFTASLRGTYVTKYEFQVEVGGRWFNPLGNYNPQFAGPVIRYQQVLNLGYEQGPWSGSLTNRYMTGYRDQNAQGAPFNVAPFNTRRVGEYIVFDASVSYKGFKGLTLQAGVLNLMDEDPPFTNQVGRFQARGYDDRFANPLGRTYQISGRYEF